MERADLDSHNLAHLKAVQSLAVERCSMIYAFEWYTLGDMGLYGVDMSHSVVQVGHQPTASSDCFQKVCRVEPTLKRWFPTEFQVKIEMAN
jgi:hypothetical protein